MWTEGGRRAWPMPCFDPSTATAIAAGGSALSAGGGILGGLLQSGAATKAATIQSEAAGRSAALQGQQFNQTQANLQPFIGGGTDALQALKVALGIVPEGQATAAKPATFNITDPNGNIVLQNATPDQIAEAQKFPAVAHVVQATAATPEIGGQANPLTANGLSGLTFQPTQAQLEATPGYQFDLAQGLRGVESSAAAQGRGISGAALKGAANYATGLANNTLTTQQQIFQQNLGNVLNPLMSVAGMGEGAATGLGQIGQNTSQAIGNTLVGGANAQAAGTVGSANAISNSLSGLGNSATNFLLFNALTNGTGANNPNVFTSGPATFQQQRQFG